jgi:membrane-bound lytic murein transglycosylase B
MFVCRRFLQLGLLTALLGDYNNIPKTEGKPLESSGQISKTDAIRIGPTAPEAQTDTADTPAALTSSGQLRPDIQAYSQTLASERSQPALGSSIGHLGVRSQERDRHSSDQPCPAR